MVSVISPAAVAFAIISFSVSTRVVEDFGTSVVDDSGNFGVTDDPFEVDKMFVVLVSASDSSVVFSPSSGVDVFPLISSPNSPLFGISVELPCLMGVVITDISKPFSCDERISVDVEPMRSVRSEIM